MIRVDLPPAHAYARTHTHTHALVHVHVHTCTDPLTSPLPSPKPTETPVHLCERARPGHTCRHNLGFATGSVGSASPAVVCGPTCTQTRSLPHASRNETRLPPRRETSKVKPFQTVLRRPIRLSQNRHVCYCIGVCWRCNTEQ